MTSVTRVFAENELLEAIYQRLAYTPKMSVQGFLRRQYVFRQMPRYNLVARRECFDLAEFERWYAKTFQPSGTGPLRGVVNAYELHRALDFLRTHSDLSVDTLPGLSIAAGIEELPYLHVQTENAVARVSGRVTGDTPWRFNAPFVEFDHMIADLKRSVTLHYRARRHRLSVGTRTKPNALDNVFCTYPVVLPTFGSPNEGDLLGWALNPWDEMVDSLQKDLQAIWQEHKELMPTGLEAQQSKVAEYLATPCRIRFIAKRTPFATVSFQVGKNLYQQDAIVRKAWEGSIPLEYLLWLGTAPFRFRCQFYLEAPDRLRLTDIYCSDMVLVPLGS